MVSYAVDVTETSAFVATEWTAREGEAITLSLSFPRLLAAVELVAHVDEQSAPSGPGAPAGLRLRFAPDARLTALVARARDVTQAASRGCRILLVEDNGFIRELFDHGMRAFFAGRGACTIDPAESAEIAWQRLADAAYDVAIVDHYLPAETGAGLIERVRRDARFCDLPVVAVSVGGRDARDAALAAGADLFLDKPLVFRDLFNTLRMLEATL